MAIVGRHLIVVALLFPALAAAGQDARESRQSQTVRYRDVPDIVEEIAAEAVKHEKAFVVWLIDNTSALKSTGQGELLARSITKHFKGARAHHAVLAFGEKPSVILNASNDINQVATAIRALAEYLPDNAVKNCLFNVREAARYAASATGAKRYLVLFTQENGDNEDDLELTLAFLKKGGVTFYPIAPEAIHNDPFWDSFYLGINRFSAGADPEVYRKLDFTFKGPESAYLEFPYGWPFAHTDPQYTVPSGYGYYALDRLATHSGGKYFMYNVNRSSGSFCTAFPCPICAGHHRCCGATFDVTKLLVTAPDVGSRGEVLGRNSSEPLFVANMNAWERLHREGILAAGPQVDLRGGMLAEVGNAARGPRGHGPRSGANWSTLRRQALRDAEDVAKVGVELLEAEKQLGPKADIRVLATTDALVVHYKMLAETFKQFAAFCAEMDRIERTKRVIPSDGFVTHILDDYVDKEFDGFTWHNLWLCHGGGAGLKNVRFLGDLKELHETLDLADRMIDKHRGTPWEVLIRRAYLPVFRPIVHVNTGGGKPPKPKATSSAQDTATTPARPQRPTRGNQGGGGSTGTSSGP